MPDLKLTCFVNMGPAVCAVNPNEVGALVAVYFALGTLLPGGPLSQEHRHMQGRAGHLVQG